MPDREGGERRRVVLMFSDVVSSTEISGRLDPEEWRELLVDYHRAAASAVTGLGGYVAQYYGDGVLAYFGWPVAHENDAERAAAAGHAILDSVAELNRARAEIGLLTFGIRIGIHVGEVVISGLGSVYGEAPNIAARVQAIAGINTVVATEPVFLLIGGRIGTEDLGEHALKGVDRPSRLYRVLSPRRVRRDPRGIPGRSRFVGRQVELDTILERWDRARAGIGQIVTVTGEAGIGKSRLMREFRTRIRGRPHFWLELGGSEIFRSTPFYPVVRLLDRLVGTADVSQPEGRRRRLERMLARAGVDDRESISAVAELLRMGPPGPGARDASRVAERRARQVGALVALVLRGLQRQPAVVLLEDVHWMDPSTLELSHALMGAATDAPLLMIETARPGFDGSWPQASPYTHMTLRRLGRADICELVKSTTTTDPLADSLVESIADRSSGIPLFAEELARLIEIRGGTLKGTEIPDSLAASLTARLDQAGSAREIAQIVAVIGDEVSEEVVSVVAERKAGELEPLLDRLVAADILSMNQRSSGRVFAFEHALLRSAAYETLLHSRRRALHERVANTLVYAFPAMADAHPEVVARHLSSAGRHDRAAAEWYRAAQVALSRGAYREAEETCHEALASLEGWPESPERDALHVKVQSSLVSVLQVTDGYSAPRTAEAADRARELAEKVGNLEELMAEVAGRWAALSSAGKYGTASLVADQFFALARQDGRRDSLANAHLIQMTSRYRLGNLVGAERSFQQGETLFAEEGFRGRLGAVAQTFGNASRNAWMLGRPDEARRRMTHGIAVVSANKSPYDMAFAQYMAAILAVLMRNGREARRLAEQSMNLSDKNGFPQFAAISRIALGRALVDIAPSAEAVEMIGAGIARMVETGSRVTMTLYLAWLAEAQALVGSPLAAVETIDRALTFNPEELLFRPELLRIRGELHSATGNADGAETDVLAAVDGAAGMKALSLELRAAISLHRLRSRRGGSGAREMIATIFSRFSEGHDTPDLAEAAAIVRDGA